MAEEIAQSAETEFEWETFDRRAGRLVKTPELTIQAGGSISVNAAAYKALGEPEAVEFLFDSKRNVVGLRKVDKATAHAYPLRGVGKGGTGQTYVASPRAFFSYYDIPLGIPIRRDVKMVNDVLIVDLNDPGRPAISNRNRAKLTAQNDGDSETSATSPSDAAQTSAGATAD
jgi:hypothetical protein